MIKREALLHWSKLTGEANPLQHMDAIPDKSTGSRYGCCGIRIDGSPEFIDAVLGKLTDLIDGENHYTRLELSRHEVEPVEINGVKKTFENADVNAEVCYIRLHERGRAEGKMASARFDRTLDAATARYEKIAH